MAEQSSNVVLMAMDESEHSTRALEWYVKSVHNPQHKLVVASVVDVAHEQLVVVGAFPAAKSPSGYERKRQHLEEFLKQKLAQSPFKEMSPSIETKILEGQRPGEVIVEAAGKMHAQLVVMGTRGLGTVRRTLLGSVSDYVLHHAHCPVFVCRFPDKA